MITLVFFDEFDSEYSVKENDFSEAITQSGLLIVTENINDGFDAVEKHQKENPDAEIDYCFQFWNNGEVFTNALVSIPMQEAREEVLSYIKSFYH